MDYHQQVFHKDINLRPKKVTKTNALKKKKQSMLTELLAHVKTAKYRFQPVPILYGEQQKWNERI